MAITTNLVNVPKEVLSHIAKFLDHKSIARLSGTCKKIFNFVKSCKWINDGIPLFIMKKEISKYPAIERLIDVRDPKAALIQISNLLHPSSEEAKSETLRRLIQLPTDSHKDKVANIKATCEVSELMLKVGQYPIPVKKCTIL